MHEVVIAGVGQTQVGEHWELSLRELAFNALEATRADAGGLRPQALYAAIPAVMPNSIFLPLKIDMTILLENLRQYFCNKSYLLTILE